MTAPLWYRSLSYLGDAVEITGALIGLARWKFVGRAERMIALWFSAAVLSDLLEALLKGPLQNVQPIAAGWVLASALLALEALARTQTTSARALPFRLAAAGYAVAWLVLHATIDPWLSYSAYAAPLHAVVVLAAAGLVVFRRMAIGRTDPLVDPTFVLAAGLCGYAVSDVFRVLGSYVFYQINVDYINVVLAVCTVGTILAEFFLMRVFLLPQGSTATSARRAVA